MASNSFVQYIAGYTVTNFDLIQSEVTLQKQVYRMKNFNSNICLSGPLYTGPHSAVGNVSDCRYVSNCRYSGCEFDPGPDPYFFGD